MVDRKHQNLRRILDRVLDAPPSERDAILEEECRGDTDLRRRLLDMIAAAESERAPSNAPAAGRGDGSPAAGPMEAAGTRLGPYKLMEKIGEGGFGSVFLAEQEAPVQRKVAIKIIKLGMDTRQVVARFEQEQQALAMMEHPNIAKVLDAGATDRGRPYFVMDLVRGLPLTQYCDKNKLTTRERLELFLPVCDAIQHAHQKGIIHRDIKPSNILVTLSDGKPVPKVIDFGIAKATGPRLTEKTVYTEFRQVIGTPAYMSPEQIDMSGLDIDTRSDLYGLGVLLYELLTGTTPYDNEDLDRAGFGEIQRIIRDVEPPRPSTRLRTLGEEGTKVAVRRRTEPKKLEHLIRGDLDWIVMKALEKDRTRRYATASDFAADIQHHLCGEPVEAAPPSRTYRLRKFVRRRRGLVVAVASVVLAVLAGLAATGIALVQARRAYESEREARSAEALHRKRAERITDFLQGMFASIDPEQAQGRDVTVKSVLDDAAARLDSGFADEPEVEAWLRHTFGETYFQLGRYRESKEQFLRAADLRARTVGPEHRETLGDRFGAAVAMLQLGELDGAVRALDETLEAQSRVLGARDPDTLQTRSVLGHTKQLLGDNEGALADYRVVLADQTDVLGAGHKTTLETMCSVADVLQEMGRLDEAEGTARRLVSAANEAQGPDGAQTLIGKSILVAVLNDLGRFEEAEPLGREVLAAKTRIYGPDHSETLMTANVLATTLENLNRFDEACDLLRHAADASAASLGEEHSTTLTYLANLARVEQLRGHLDEAERIFRSVLETRLRVSGEEATSTLAVMNNLGLLLLLREKPAEAEPILRRMSAGIEKAMPEGHWMRGQAKVNLGRSLAQQARYEEAEPLLLAGFEQLSAALPAGHPRRTNAAEVIGNMYRSWGKPDREAEWRGRN